MKKIWCPVLITFIVFLSGCSLNYEEAIVAEDMDKDIPETVLWNIRHTAIRNGRPAFVIEADKSESYSKKEQTIMIDVLFKEFDQNGQIITEGRADRAVINTDTEDAELFGNLHAYSLKEQSEIFSNYLYWNSEKKTLTGKPEEMVNIQKDSGSRISGRGFSVDFRSLKVNFTDDISGSFVEEPEENTQDNTN